MQIDFHYCVIKLLTLKAGFSEEEAQIIAYASQYVDDAVDSHKMKVIGSFNFNYERYDGKYFDPVRTAHEGFQFIEGLKKDVQKKVYISFHFIPPEAFRGQEFFEFRTAPNTPLALKMVNHALKQLEKTTNQEERLKALIKLGIVLHSYADTWSHQKFSGRHNSHDNDIENISLFVDGKWKDVGFWEQLEFNTFPDIGHAEAFCFPDQSHRTWRYKQSCDGQLVERNNTNIFMDAANHIYDLLAATKPNPEEWQDFAYSLHKCLAFPTADVTEKFKIYQETFREIKFHYNKNEWRDTAILETPPNPAKRYRLKRTAIQLIGDPRWFYFHIEAMNQRYYIMSRLPKKLK